MATTKGTNKKLTDRLIFKGRARAAGKDYTFKFTTKDRKEFRLTIDLMEIGEVEMKSTERRPMKEEITTYVPSDPKSKNFEQTVKKITAAIKKGEKVVDGKILNIEVVPKIVSITRTREVEVINIVEKYTSVKSISKILYCKLTKQQARQYLINFLTK